MSEADKSPGVEKVNAYMQEKLDYYKVLLENMQDDRNPDWEPLEKAFREMLK